MSKKKKATDATTSAPTAPDSDAAAAPEAAEKPSLQTRVADLEKKIHGRAIYAD